MWLHSPVSTSICLGPGLPRLRGLRHAPIPPSPLSPGLGPRSSAGRESWEARVDIIDLHVGRVGWGEGANPHLLVLLCLSRTWVCDCEVYGMYPKGDVIGFLPYRVMAVGTCTCRGHRDRPGMPALWGQSGVVGMMTVQSSPLCSSLPHRHPSRHPRSAVARLVWVPVQTDWQ